MKVLTAAEAARWEHLPSDFDPREIGNPSENKRDRLFGLRSECGSNTALSIQIAAACKLPALLWIEYPPVFYDMEELPLFTLCRRAFNDDRGLEAAPAQLFVENECDALTAFIALVLYYSFNANLFEFGRSRSWGFNHDEFLFFRSDDPEIYSEAADLVRRFELDEWR